MKLDDLDRILSSEKPIAPSSSFVGNVMSRVQAETTFRFHSPFPWIPLALGIIPLVILIVLFGPADPVSRSVNQLTTVLSEWIVSSADLALRNTILLAAASLLVTLMLAWLSLRLTDAKY